MRYRGQAHLAVQATALLFGILVVFISTAASDITVVAVDDAGQAVRGVTIQCVPETGPTFRLTHGAQLQGTTGLDGQTTCRRTIPGTWRIAVLRLDDPTLISPDHNPFISSPVVLLSQHSQDATVELELWRGAPMMLDLTSLPPRGARLPVEAAALLENLDTGFSLAQPIILEGGGRLALVPGQWMAGLEVSPGWLVTKASLDRSELDRAEILLEVTNDPTARWLAWEVTGETLVEGTVTIDGREPVEIEAVLLEPGYGLEAARTRGQNVPERILARTVWQSPGRFGYEIVLPAGRWYVGAAAPARSEPTSVELDLQPGDGRRIDFDASPGQSEATQLEVWVWPPKVSQAKDALREWPRFGLSGATVGLWHEGDDPAEDPPVHLAQTEQRHGARFSEVEEGTWQVVAWHDDFLPTQLEIEIPGPELVNIHLARGAVILATVFDENTEPTADVELWAELLDEPPQSPTGFPSYTRHQQRGDSGGLVVLTGLVGGRYRLGGRALGSNEATHMASFRVDGKLSSQPEIVIAANEEREIEVLLLPAASIEVRVACRYRENLPGSLSVRVFEVEVTAPDQELEPELSTGALLALDDLPIRSGGFVKIGPMPGRAVQLAMRPTGHDIWTWAPGSLDREAGLSLPLWQGPANDLGLSQLHCDPLVLVTPSWNDSPLPRMDLADMTVSFEMNLEEGEIEASDDSDQEPEEASVTQVGDVFRIDDLMEGDFELTVRLEHQYLMPDGRLERTYQLVLERGRTQRLELEVDQLGGVLEVTTTAPWILLEGDDGTPRINPGVDGRAVSGVMPPGVWLVRGCHDEVCSSLSEQATKVVVEGGATTRVNLDW